MLHSAGSLLFLPIRLLLLAQALVSYFLTLSLQLVVRLGISALPLTATTALLCVVILHLGPRMFPLSLLTTLLLLTHRAHQGALDDALLPLAYDTGVEAGYSAAAATQIEKELQEEDRTGANVKAMDNRSVREEISGEGAVGCRMRRNAYEELCELLPHGEMEDRALREFLRGELDGWRKGCCEGVVGDAYEQPGILEQMKARMRNLLAG